MLTQTYGVAPDEALHLLGWQRRRHAPLPCTLLGRMAEYAGLAAAHDGYEQTLGLPDHDQRAAAERRFRDTCPLAADYLALFKTPEGLAALRRILSAYD